MVDVSLVPGALYQDNIRGTFYMILGVYFHAADVSLSVIQFIQLDICNPNVTFFQRYEEFTKFMQYLERIA